jgi:hypothetical protein
VKRRIGVIVLVTAALSTAGTAAQALVDNTTASHWGCVGVQAANVGVCVSNPLPERLPIPATPSAPSLPS